jgi:hypothetical protein
MSPLADVARFRPDDPDPLVVAAFTCPLCLGEQVEWDAHLDGYDPSVECHCSRCNETWPVYLAPLQALRLGLMPAAA